MTTIPIPKLEVGDIVTFQYLHPSKNFDGMITHIPQNSGDMWHVINELGYLALVNPTCSDLYRVIRLTKQSFEPTKELLRDQKIG